MDNFLKISSYFFNNFYRVGPETKSKKSTNARELNGHPLDYFYITRSFDLVELPHRGIIAIMDEACLSVGNITDQTV